MIGCLLYKLLTRRHLIRCFSLLHQKHCQAVEITFVFPVFLQRTFVVRQRGFGKAWCCQLLFSSSSHIDTSWGRDKQLKTRFQASQLISKLFHPSDWPLFLKLKLDLRNACCQSFCTIWHYTEGPKSFLIRLHFLAFLPSRCLFIYKGAYHNIFQPKFNYKWYEETHSVRIRSTLRFTNLLMSDVRGAARVLMSDLRGDANAKSQSWNGAERGRGGPRNISSLENLRSRVKRFGANCYIVCTAVLFTKALPWLDVRKFGINDVAAKKGQMSQNDGLIKYKWHQRTSVRS